MNRKNMHENYCITCIVYTVCIIIYQTFSKIEPFQTGRENVTIKT